RVREQVDGLVWDLDLEIVRARLDGPAVELHPFPVHGGRGPRIVTTDVRGRRHAQAPGRCETQANPIRPRVRSAAQDGHEAQPARPRCEDLASRTRPQDNGILGVGPRGPAWTGAQRYPDLTFSWHRDTQVAHGDAIHRAVEP